MIRRSLHTALLVSATAFVFAATALRAETDATETPAPGETDSTVVEVPVRSEADSTLANTAVPAETDSTVADMPANNSTKSAEGETRVSYLVPALEGGAFRVTNDKEKYKNRISFSPGIGQLGSQDLFAFRAGFAPNTWLAYEISLGHNPATSLHGLLHTFNVILRYPLPWRAQPYVTLGYGMITVHPGQAINADPVSKNALTAGGGLEFYVRDDISLRAEMRGASVLGTELGSDETVAYNYREYTLGFAFYRSLGK